MNNIFSIIRKSTGHISAFVVVLINVLLQSGCHKNSIRANYIMPNCPPIIINGYKFRGDLIHSSESAKAIGKILVKDFNSSKNNERSAGVDVSDLGQTWKISEYLKKNVYGGNIEFQIDKCTGAVRSIIIYRD